MANWVTHLMIADRVMELCPGLHRRGFCVGNIAPDCNVENEDWTAFTPSREVTHWMSGERKNNTDCNRFYEEYLIEHLKQAKSPEERGFLLGYYSHLLTDAAFQRHIRDEERVKASWARVMAQEELAAEVKRQNYPATWDSVKKLIPRKERMQMISTIEAEYLKEHPDSGYLTEILPLTEFPDYIDYLPTGCVVRKIGVMGYLPQEFSAEEGFIGMTREEYIAFIEDAVQIVTDAFREKGLQVCLIS